MRRIALLVPKITPFDAVSNDILGMSSHLKLRGFEVRIFAADSPGVREVSHDSRLPAFLKEKDDLLIYHYAVAWDRAYRLFRELNCKKILRYHNVTPPEFFEAYHPGIAQACRAGRSMVSDFIKAGTDLYLADSDFNGGDLREAGADEKLIYRVPPFHQVEKLRSADADLRVIAEYTGGYEKTGPMFLMVGRIAPNKGYENLLRAFALYRANFAPEARLVVVGKADAALRDYNRKLDALIDEYDLYQAVTFAGAVSDSVLKSFYLSASGFITMSEHEGFCVPLIEAMALRVPVVALARTAVAETLGDAGLSWEEADPKLFAASLARLAEDRELAGILTDRGEERYRLRFDNSVVASLFDKALAQLSV